MAVVCYVVKRVVSEKGQDYYHYYFKNNTGKPTHVGCDEHPLRKRIICQIFFKQSEILDIRAACCTIGHRVIYNQGTCQGGTDQAKKWR